MANNQFFQDMEMYSQVKMDEDFDDDGPKVGTLFDLNGPSTA